MLTCFTRYEIDPRKVPAVARYARGWVRAMPRCGAEAVGFFLPEPGRGAVAYGIFNVEDLAAYDQFRARLSGDELHRANLELAQGQDLFRREDLLFLRPAMARGRAHRP